MKHFQDMAYGCARATLGGRAAELAEDAAQEAMIAAWRHLPTLRDPAAFPGWLRQIVVHRCRRVAQAATAEPLPESLPAGDAWRDAERPLVIRQALDSLPEAERLAVVLFHVGQYTRGEVAAFLGVSEVAVKKRLASGRARLRERLLAMLEDDLHESRPSNGTAFTDRVQAFTKLLAATVDAGAPLVSALRELAAQETDPEFRAALEEVADRLNAGETLSLAMDRHRRFFPERYTLAIRAGEYRGEVDGVLRALADGTHDFGAVPVPSADHERARIAASAARQRFGHPRVEPEHQLLGLLEQDGSMAVDWLRAAGVDIAALQAAVEGVLARSAPEGEAGGPSDAARAVRQAASDLAAQAGTARVGTRFLLRALTEAEGSEAARLLQGAGATAP